MMHHLFNSIDEPWEYYAEWNKAWLKEATYCAIPSIQNAQNKQTHGDKKQISGFQRGKEE